MSSFVYFFRRPNGQIKIGRSGNVAARRLTVQRQEGCQLKVLAIVHGGPSLEAALHREFSTDRLDGEWFSPSDGLTAKIAQLVASDAPPEVATNTFKQAWLSQDNCQTFLSALANKIVSDRPSAQPKSVAISNLSAGVGGSAEWLRHLMSDPSLVKAEADQMLRLVDLYELHCEEQIAAAEARIIEMKGEAAAAATWKSCYGIGRTMPLSLIEEGWRND